MRLLVLGGTAFAGRAVVAEAVRRGWSVTVFARGVTGPPPAGAELVRGDRTVAGDLERLGDGPWDAVVDTWRADSVAVAESTARLRGSVGAYALVSSLAVYELPGPRPLDESAPLVATDGFDAADEYLAYAAAKLIGERAVQRHFGDRGLVLRAGLVLGPYEYAGRLPWWLLRFGRGGSTLAPAPTERAVQYIDTRDLAVFALDLLAQGQGGTFNVVCPRGHATMRTLLDACRQATGARSELVWVDEEALLAHGVRPWTELPIWIPAAHELAGSYDVDVGAAVAAGLTCRAVEATVDDTWTWLASLTPEQRLTSAGQHKPWLAADKEAAVLRAWRDRAAVRAR